MLTIHGEPWWRFESAHRERIAFGILFHRTDDRELAEARAKAFALEILGPLVGPATILDSAIDAWLMEPPNRPAPVRRPAPSSLAIPCTSCGTLVPAAARHYGILQVFGSLCDRCRAVPV